MSENYCVHGVPTKSSPWRFTSIDVKDCPYCEIDRLGAQIAEWHKVFGHLSKDADTAGNIINEGIAERDKEIEKLTHAGNRMAADCNKLFDENSTLRAEVERLKEGKANRATREHAEAHQLGIDKGRKQAAREIVEIISSTGFWASHFDLSTYHALQTHLELLISEKFGLEG